MLFSRDGDAVLRAVGRFAPVAPGTRGGSSDVASRARGAAPVWARLLLCVVVSGSIYGGMMGAFHGLSPLIFLSAIKVPLLIVVSTLLALPAIFVVNTVCGLRDDFSSVLRGILAAQATVAITLHALGPILLLIYATTKSYPIAKAANGSVFLVASVAGQLTLHAHYAPLVELDDRHRVGRRVWWFLYALVTIQMAWVLRPFIGAPDMPIELFREEAWGNAYVELLKLARRLAQ